jgi:hypothetical protein
MNGVRHEVGGGKERSFPSLKGVPTPSGQIGVEIIAYGWCGDC